MRAFVRMRGVSVATRYHAALKIGRGINRRGGPRHGPPHPPGRLGTPRRSRGAPRSRQPFPELQAEPVDHLASPDPGVEPAVDLDLAHALHAGAQALDLAIELGLDAEEVVAFLRGRDRRDLLDDERHRLGRAAREQQPPALPTFTYATSRSFTCRTTR